MKKLKICSVLLAACILLTSCSTNNTGSSGGESSSTSTSATASSPETTVPETTVPETTVPETTVPETTVPETTVPETSVPETSVPETSVPETTVPETTAPEVPKWTEEAAEGSFYITTDCYERLSAYVGAPAGNLLKRGSKVNVTALTDTGYYKMENDRYVHKDYVSKNKPSETVQPTGSLESEINKIKLKPVRTNIKVLDDLVDKILAKIITKDMTNSQKLKAAYDYIITNSTYVSGIFMYNDLMSFTGDKAYMSEYDMETAFFAYEILSTGEGVCDNYASAFTVLTRAIGFESYSTSGHVAYSGGGYTGHRWNNIKIGDTWYEFDSQIEDKYNELNGYTSYTFYGKVRNSNPTLYIYPEDENYYIKKYKGFKFADALKADITISAGGKKLEAHHEQMKPNLTIWGDYEYIDEFLICEDLDSTELTITLSVDSGTAPYDFDVAVYNYIGNENNYLFEDGVSGTDKKTVTYKLPLSGYDVYTIAYMIRDSSSRELRKKTSVILSDNSPVQADIKINKITSEYGNTKITTSFTGGGYGCYYDIMISETETWRNIGYIDSGNGEYYCTLEKGKTYLINFNVTDSKGDTHYFEKEYTYE